MNVINEGNKLPEKFLHMEELLSTLRNVRESAENANIAKKALIDEVKKSDIYTSLEAAEMLAQSEIERLTEQIREEALTDYELDHNKHPHPKVEIKHFKVFSITNLETLTAWCEDKMRVAFKLDTKQVEKYALKNPEVLPPGTSISEEVKVQIAREL